MKSSIFVLFAALIACALASGEWGWEYPEKPDYPKKPDYYPPKYPSLDKVVGKRFDILVALLKYTGLLHTVIDLKGITIFAPTDTAFQRTAKELGCKTYGKDSYALKCIKGALSKEQLIDILTYHVLDKKIPSSKMGYTDKFVALNKKYIYKKGLKLIDLAPKVTDPKLIAKLLDIYYDNGIIHAINRVLIPFPVFYHKPSPCDYINEKRGYVLIGDKKVDAFLFKKVVKKCYAVQRAIKYCDYSYKDVCKYGVAKSKIIRYITVGKAVAAANKCPEVAKAIYKCRYYY